MGVRRAHARKGTRGVRQHRLRLPNTGDVRLHRIGRDPEVDAEIERLRQAGWGLTMYQEHRQRDPIYIVEAAAASPSPDSLEQELSHEALHKTLGARGLSHASRTLDRISYQTVSTPHQMGRRYVGGF